MKLNKFLLLWVSLVFIGCSVSNTTEKVQNFAKCYIHKLPAPFWVCYQSSFLSIGKTHSDKLSRLKQEEAYSLGVTDLISKLQSKTKLFLRKLDVKNDKLITKVKDFVVLNAIQGDSWYDKKDKMIYVQVKLNKDEFKKFLFDDLKNKDKKVLENTFYETF